MDETCIVCLGDLAGGSPPSRRPSVVESGVDGLDHRLADNNNNISVHIKHEPNEDDYHHDDFALLDASSAIAHLLPCGHNLHNECLKPWVERANSCPICRASFNMVELKSRINGPTLDSYAVQDKKQVAEIDPSMLIDDDLFDEPAIEPCIFCEEYGEDELLLLCDGCNASCHTYCAGLNAVPAGPWFCQFCVEDQILHHSPPAATSPRRRRGRQGRQRSDGSGEAWARVWQSVWDNLNLDLDFPFDDEVTQPQTTNIQRTDTQRRDFAQWQRRFHIAERLGGAARFRDTATTLLDRAPPPPESQDELRAWNAFDKAKELQDNDTNVITSPGSRKRKSAPASPAESAPEPERKLKRPRTRRAQDIADASSDAGGESSTSVRRMTEPSIVPPVTSHRQDASLPVPSFFQSLLKEVETTPLGSKKSNLTIDVSAPTDYFPPASISPVSSPSTSRQPSPHLGPSSPPPNYHSRPSSPPPLTSRIEPVYAMPSQNHSPSARIAGSSDSDDSAPDIVSRYVNPPRGSRQSQPPLPSGHEAPHLQETRLSALASRKSHARSGRRHAASDASSNLSSLTNLPRLHRRAIRPSPASKTSRQSLTKSASTQLSSRRKDKQSRSSFQPSSPSQPSISLATKNEVREMVKAVLRPIYKSRKINTQQYTDVNMSVSRMLYERVGEVGGLLDDDERERWRAVAAEEVDIAIKRLGKGSDRLQLSDEPESEPQQMPQSDRVRAAA